MLYLVSDLSISFIAFGHFHWIKNYIPHHEGLIIIRPPSWCHHLIHLALRFFTATGWRIDYRVKSGLDILLYRIAVSSFFLCVMRYYNFFFFGQMRYYNYICYPMNCLNSRDSKTENTKRKYYPFDLYFFSFKRGERVEANPSPIP